MKINVKNKRPVQVVVDGHAFRPRSTTPVEADERLRRRIAARYGLEMVKDEPEQAADAVLPARVITAGTIGAPGEQPDPDLTCPECGRVCGSAIGLRSHRNSHKEA